MVGTNGAFGPVRFPVYPPSGSEGAVSPEQPVEAPVLEHVHGFHVAARPPVLFLAERSVAVAAGKLVVMIDLDSKRQRFIRGHTGAVTCLAFSSEQGFGASGQLLSSGAKCAEVLIWTPAETQPCALLSFHQADIEAMNFVQGGQLLVTISADRDHTLALWNVAKDGALRCRRREKVPLVVCSAYKSGIVNGVLAAPERKGQAPEFVTFGASHIKFWKSPAIIARLSPTLSSRRGAFSEGSPQSVVHVAWTPSGKLIAGGSEGQIYFFEGTRAIRRIHQQNHSVAMLLPLKDALLVVYAHGVCSLLHGGSEPRAVDIDLAALPGAPDARMQSPFVGGKAWRQSSLVLASRTHLLLVDIAGDLREPRSCETLLLQPSKAITAVCAHPSAPRFFTGSLDGGVRCFRSDTHEALPERSFKTSTGVTCLALSGCSPGGAAWLAVGCEDSTLAVLGENSLNYVFRRCLAGRGDRRARLTCAAFSSCDCSGAHPLWLAVGADDGSIHTFRFKDPTCRFETHTGPETMVKAATLRGHGAAVVSVAFASTLPCAYLLSVDSSGQELAFDVPMGHRLSSVALVRDVPFTPWTSPVGWQVQGCWTSQRPPVDASKVRLPTRCFTEVVGRSIVAASDAASPAVELFPFPCPTSPSQPIPRLDGPASPIAALLHGACSDRLIAASDALIFVWGWPAKPHWEPASSASAIGSPLRPSHQAGVVFDTPEGQKLAVAAEDALLLTPQPKSPAYLDAGSATKENFAATANLGGQAPLATPWAVDWDKDKASGRAFRAPPAHALWNGGVPDPRRGFSAPPQGRRTYHEQQPGQEDVVPELPQMGEATFSAMPEVAALPCEPQTLLEEALPTTQPAPWTEAQTVEPLPPAGTSVEGHQPLPVFYFGGAPGESNCSFAEAGHSRLHARAGGVRDFVSPKIGAAECGGVGQVSRNTQWVHEDTEARARGVHQRQLCDTVGMLIGGSEPSAGRRRSNSVGAVAALGAQGHENEAGHFRYRVREAGPLLEVEASLPGGRLLRVMRNPLRRTLTFEGEAVSGQHVPERRSPPRSSRAIDRRQPLPDVAEERLVVRIPAGFDLMGAPAHVERAFSEGHCLVALHRSGQQKYTQASSWAGSEL